jgi:hypothetical protein
VIVPADMANLVGSLAGIGALVRAGQDQPPPRPTPPPPAQPSFRPGS